MIAAIYVAVNLVLTCDRHLGRRSSILGDDKKPLAIPMVFGIADADTGNTQAGSRSSRAAASGSPRA